MIELQVFLGLGVLAIFGGALVLVLHKVRRCYLMQYDVLARLDRIEGPGFSNLYRQIEALWNLYRDLGLESSLPPMRGWATSPDFLHLLALHALKMQPQVAVECSSGVSTLVLARCMAIYGKGHVYSLEHSPEFAAKTRANLARLGLTEFATVIDAPLKLYQISGTGYKWYDLGNLPNCKADMLVIDGPPATSCKMARYPAGPLLFPILNRGAYVFLDDAAREDEKSAVDLWSEEESVKVLNGFAQAEKGCCVLTKI